MRSPTIKEKAEASSASSLPHRSERWYRRQVMKPATRQLFHSSVRRDNRRTARETTSLTRRQFFPLPGGPDSDLLSSLQAALPEAFFVPQFNDQTLFSLLVLSPSSLPHSLFLFSSLTELQIVSDLLSGTFPSELGLLKTLTSLSVDAPITSFPTEIGLLTSLSTLFLTHSSIISLPTELSATPLTSLTLISCPQFSDFPDSLSLARLQQLTVSQTPVRSLRGVNFGPSLLRITMVGTGLVGFPADVLSLSRLESVYFSKNNYLQERLPPYLGSITTLRYVSFQSNLNVNGEIPTEYAKLRNLEYFSIDDELISGNIPPFFFNMTKLSHLTIRSTRIGGRVDELPFQSNSSISQLDLSDNWLEGTVPDKLFNLTHLKYLDLSRNLLFGTIPTLLYSSQLETVVLDLQYLSGTLSPLLRNMTTLISFSVSINFISGTLPPELFLLPNIKAVNMSINALSGALPSNISSSLTSIDLSTNQLTGSINPMLITTLLQTLSLSTNFLSGTLPPVDPDSQLSIMSVSSCQLTGSIPSIYLNLTSLQQLDVSNNSLTGSICSLTQPLGLISLNIGRNNISSTIPVQFFPFLSSVSSLSLGHNSLNGTIPQNLDQLVSLNSLDLSFNQFEGFLPTSLGQLTSLTSLDVSSNRLKLSPHFSWNCSHSYSLIALADNMIDQFPLDLFVGCKIDNVDLSRNRLNFDIQSVHNLRFSDIAALNISHNSLAGDLSDSFFDDPMKLRVLDLSFNNLTGVVPERLCNGLNAGYQGSGIFLQDNRLTGTIPARRIQSTVVNQLNIAGNQLSGTLPNWVYYLTYLNVSRNNISGSLPAIYNSSTLDVIDISYNQFVGNLSVEYNIVNLPKKKNFIKSSIDMSYNNISGNVRGSPLGLQLTEIATTGNTIECINLPRSCERCFPCFSPCGDGLVYANEQCDDGNTESGDGCNSACQIEPGWTCQNFPDDTSLVIAPKPSTCIQNEGDNKKYIIAIVVPLTVILLLLIIVLVYIASNRRKVSIVEVPEKDIKFEYVLGEGNFGKVYAGLLRNTTRVAIKELTGSFEDSTMAINSANKNIKSSLMREAKLMASLPPHPNIVQFLGVSFSEQSRSIFILTQFVPNGSLQSYLKKNALYHRFGADKLLEIVVGIAAGMEHLHKHSIIHNDLSARNVLVEEGIIREESDIKSQIVAKVSDFGLAGSNRFAADKTSVIPIRWSPPELFSPEGKRSFKSDVWSFGVVMYEVMTLCSHLPYHSMINSEVRTFIKQQRRLPQPKACPEDIYNLMMRCWEEDPAQRPSFETITSELMSTSLFKTRDSSILSSRVDSTNRSLGERHSPEEGMSLFSIDNPLVLSQCEEPVYEISRRHIIDNR